MARAGALLALLILASCGSDSPSKTPDAAGVTIDAARAVDAASAVDAKAVDAAPIDAAPDAKDLCVGVVCTASDFCHLAGTCDPSTGTCSNPLALGKACDDHDACTKKSACDAQGVCAGSDPVVCVALDQCHLAGTCDKVTGECPNPLAPDTKPCDDGSMCSKSDHCDGAGFCVGDDVVVCNQANDCALKACDPATGICGAPKVPVPVSSWRGEGNFMDSVGTNHGASVGTVNGGVHFAAGRIGQAFDFDGSDDAVKLPLIPAMGGRAVTIAAWVRARALGRGQQWILGASFSTQLVISPGDKLEFQYKSDGPFRITEDPVLAPLNTWVHVIVELYPVLGANPPQTSVRIYRNGKLAILQTLDGEPTFAGCESSIGGIACTGFDTDQNFNGLLDEVLFYDRALRPEEVVTLYGAEADESKPDGASCGGACTCLQGSCECP